MGRTSLFLRIGVVFSLGAGLGQADNLGDSRRASLETTPAPLGGVFSGAIRSTEIGAPGLLGVSAGNGPLLLPGLPVVHLDPATLFFLAVGPIDASGRLLFATGVPSDPAIAGVPVHFQGFVVVLPSAVHASSPVQVRPGASATASFSDLSATLPAVASEPNTDADFVDLDADGDLDLLLATDTGAAVLLNDGTGSLLDATSVWVPPTVVGEIASCWRRSMRTGTATSISSSAEGSPPRPRPPSRTGSS